MIVAISPHPDDAEWGAGAWLASTASRILVLTDCGRERVAEARDAAAALGADLVFSGMTDGGVTMTPYAVDEVAAHLADADTVLIPPFDDSPLRK